MDTDSTELLIERAGAVLRLTIDRPASANAINRTVALGLAGGLALASEDSDIRAVVLTGAGERAFSAGRDTKRPAHVDAAAFERQRRQEALTVTNALSEFRKPLVVALNGAAVGTGFMLALHADQVVAVSHATVSLPEIDLGIASFLGHALMTDLAGRAFANDLVLTGRRANAEEAMQHGLVHAIVPANRLLAEAEARASMLAAKPADTFADVKGWILERRRAAIEQALARAAMQDAPGWT